jgi:hypothetical protein
MITIPPDFDWPAWLTRDDVTPDRKAAGLAKFITAHGTLPEGCEFVWSELTKLAGAGRVADALLPRLCRLLPSNTLAALCRSTPETHIRDFVAKLIFLGTSDPSLTPPLSAMVSVLDDERLASVIMHLGPLAGMYPAAEPQMGQRVLVWLKQLPAQPERFFPHLAAIRAGARWLPKGVDQVRAWRQFQESFERFADVCRQMPIVFPGARQIAEREAAAQELVAALVQAAPNAWYRDDKQARGKRRLLEGLIAHAGIPAGKLPDDFPEKVARYFATGKWQAPPPPAPVPLPPEKDEPINPLTWIVPSAVGGLTLVGLFVALAGNWLLGLYHSWQMVPKPADEPPARVFAGAPLPPVKRLVLVDRKGREPGLGNMGGLAQAADETSPPVLNSAPSPFGMPPDGGRTSSPGFGPSSKRPPSVPRPVQTLSVMRVELVPPFDAGTSAVANAIPRDLTATPAGQAVGILLANLPPGDCSVQLHGHQHLAASVPSDDPFSVSSLGDLRAVDVRDQAGSVEVQATFRGEAEPVILARFSVERNVLRYEAGEPSSRGADDPQVAGLRRALRHCVLEIRPRGESRSVFVALAKPPAYRFPLDSQGSQVIHAVAGNTLDLPGGMDGGQLYLGQGRIVHRLYGSIEFGAEWLDEPAKKAWIIRTPANWSGWGRHDVALSWGGDEVTLAIQPPPVPAEPPSQRDSTAAVDRKKRIEQWLDDARKSIEPSWAQRLNDTDYLEPKMSSYVRAAQNLAAELGLEAPPELPRISSKLRVELLRPGNRGYSPEQAEAQEFKAKLGIYMVWGIRTLIPRTNLELQKLQQEIDGPPAEPAPAVMLAEQPHQDRRSSPVSVEANIYRLVSCDSPSGKRTVRVLVVEPGSGTPPLAHATLGIPAQSPWYMPMAVSGRDANNHVAASLRDAILGLGETELREPIEFRWHQR